MYEFDNDFENELEILDQLNHVLEDDDDLSFADTFDGTIPAPSLSETWV